MSLTLPAILGLGTAVPPTRYAQSEIYERYLEPHFGRHRLARAIFSHAGVSYRHVAVEGSFYNEQRSTEERNNCYWEAAMPLGESAILRALEDSALEPKDIDDLFVVSCTGLDIPGLDLRLAGRLGMRPELRRTCVLGMGCYGAFPALVRAREAVASQPGRRALVLALESCSLHLQFDDTLENIVASALFADGAAAAVIGDRERWPGRAARPRLVDAATYCDYSGFDHMAFHVTNHGFRMSLSAYVPDVLAAQVDSLVDRLIAPHALRAEDVRFWGVHPGSSKILDHVQECLRLSPSQLEFSRRVLAGYGNMSSATVLFVLDEILRTGNPAPGDYGVLMGFGPGLTLESALVQW